MILFVLNDVRVFVNFHGSKGMLNKKISNKIYSFWDSLWKTWNVNYFSYCINVKINFILITKLLKVIIYSETTGLAIIHNIVTIHEMTSFNICFSLITRNQLQELASFLRTSVLLLLAFHNWLLATVDVIYFHYSSSSNQ